MAADAAEKLEKASNPGGLSAKAVLDLFGSLALILLLSPVLIIISLCVLLTMGRPILFRQLRTGTDDWASGIPILPAQCGAMRRARCNG